MATQIPRFSLNISDDVDGEHNIYATSLVDAPATRKYFAVFSEEKQDVKQEFQIIDLPTEPTEQIVKPTENGFERIISGVWFMPDTDYPRIVDGEIAVTRMTADELTLAHTNFKKKGADNFNVMHEGQFVEGLNTIETWQLYDYNQLSPVLLNSITDLGYKAEDIPLGTVLMSVYVRNEQFFNEQILTGKVKGFSIEGFFILQAQENDICTDEDKNPDGSCKEFNIDQNKEMNKYKEMFSKMGLEQETGTLLTNTNRKLSFAEEGIKLDSELVGDETFILASGFSVVIREGKLADFGFEEVAPATDQGQTESNESNPVIEDNQLSNNASVDKQDAVDSKAEGESENVDDNTDTNNKNQSTEELISSKIQEALKNMNLDMDKHNQVLSDKDAVIAELQGKIDSAAQAAKDAAIQAKQDAANKEAIPNKSITNKPSDYSADTHRVKIVGGKKFYLLK